MDLVKKLKSLIDKRFEKHPVIGFMLYGLMSGATGTIVLILIFLGVSLISGIYSRLGINYKTWWTFIVIVAVIAVLVLIYGAIAYFPYKRKGNSLFKKEYVNGSTYKAIQKYLSISNNMR
jgi:hypothetical protein